MEKTDEGEHNIKKKLGISVFLQYYGMQDKRWSG